jgi:hypothetical protein
LGIKVLIYFVKKKKRLIHYPEEVGKGLLKKVRGGSFGSFPLSQSSTCIFAMHGKTIVIGRICISPIGQTVVVVDEVENL